MTFVIKQEYVEPHSCSLPIQRSNSNKPLVPGDLWRCDDCGQHHVWALYYGRETWFSVSDREANKRIKRHLKEKSPKRRYEGGTGLG